MKHRFNAVLVLLSLIIATSVPVALAQDSVTCSSLGTNEAVATAFVNDLGFDVTSHWVNYECVETEGSLIPAGDTYTAGTYDGHEFIFRDAAGNFAAYYVGATADSDGEVLLSEYVTVIPEWLPEETGSDEADPSVKTIITLVPIDESVRPTADCSIETGGEVTTTFWNDTGTNNEIYLYWLDPDCAEEEIYLFQDDFYYEFYSTWVGHDFVFRNPAGELLAYHKMSEADNEQWTPLSTLITVEKTTIEVDGSAFYEQHITTTVDPIRAESGIAPIVVNGELKSLAQAIVPRFDIETALLVETLGSVSVYGLDESSIAGEIATELGIELSGFQAVVVHAEGLTSDNILEILDLTLAYEGWSTAEIASFAVYQEGDLFLLLASDAVPAAEDGEEWAEFTHPDDDAAVLENVTGTFTANGNISYPFDAVEGTLYVLYYRSNDYDPYLVLNDPQGNQFLSNDDSGGGLNALIVFTAPTTGTYTALLQSFAQKPMGEYVFSVVQPSFETRGAVAVNTPISLDLEVVEGTTYFAEVTSSEVDTTLVINDASGNQVAANDDYNGTTNSFAFFIAAETGTYKIVVDSFNSASAGRFRLLTGSIE